MEKILEILLFVGVLSLLVIIHELGHFLVAKKSGMKVDEFGIGFPPRIWGRKFKGTLFSINLIPLGGFVKVFGEDEDLKNKKGSFSSKPIYARIGVVVAGVVMNFLVAWIIMSIIFAFGIFSFIDTDNANRHLDNIVDPGLFVSTIIEGSATEKAGLEFRDQILQVSSNDFSISPVSVTDFNDFIIKEKDNLIQIQYKRDGEVYTTNMEVKKIHTVGEGTIGVVIREGGTIKYSVADSFAYVGAKETIHLGYLMLEGLYDLGRSIFVEREVPEGVAGPVGIANFAGEVQEYGLIYYLQFIALLSLNLALLNILPIPALDGGKLLFLIIEAIKGSPVKNEKTVHIIGFAILIILILLVTLNDIVNIIG